MKKLTYVTPEIEYAIIANDILTESYNVGEHETEDNGGMDITPDQ